MRSIRKLFLLGVAALMVCAAVASAASATSIHTGSATGPLYSGAVTGTNVGNVVLTTSSGFGTVTCTDSTLTGSVTSSGSATISGATWTNSGGNCTNNLGQSCSTAAQNLNWTGSITYNGGSPDGFMTVSGSPYAGAKVVCGSTTCFYGASSVTVSLNNPTGGTGSRAVANVSLAKQSGSSFVCASSATWTATYSLTENGNADLYVES